MKNSDRVRWYEAAYTALRKQILPEAPPDATIAVGFPSRKKSGKHLVVGQCAFDCIADHGGGFGAENLITVTLIQGDSLVDSLATLLHEMIHASLDPEVKHGREFQQVCQRVGLQKPWTATEPNAELRNNLRAIVVQLEGDLGYIPVGKYIPPPPKPKRKTTRKKMGCSCVPQRTFTASRKLREQGTLICGVCKERFAILDLEDSQVSAG